MIPYRLDFKLKTESKPLIIKKEFAFFNSAVNKPLTYKEREAKKVLERKDSLKGNKYKLNNLKFNDVTDRQDTNTNLSSNTNTSHSIQLKDSLDL